MITKKNVPHFTQKMLEFVDDYVEKLYRTTRWYFRSPKNEIADHLKKQWYLQTLERLDKKFSLSDEKFDIFDIESKDPNFKKTLEDSVDRLISHHKLRTWKSMPKKWLEVVHEFVKEGVDEHEINVESTAYRALDLLVSLYGIVYDDMTELWNSGAAHDAVEHFLKQEMSKRRPDLVDESIRSFVKEMSRQ